MSLVYLTVLHLRANEREIVLRDMNRKDTNHQRVERNGRTVFYYYRRTVLYVVETIAFLFCVVAALLFILIVSDLLFKFNWGYPWWALLVDLGFIVVSIIIFFAAKAALGSPSQPV